jgi:hypothetical protein
VSRRQSSSLLVRGPERVSGLLVRWRLQLEIPKYSEPIKKAPNLGQDPCSFSGLGQSWDKGSTCSGRSLLWAKLVKAREFLFPPIPRRQGLVRVSICPQVINIFVLKRNKQPSIIYSGGIFLLFHPHEMGPNQWVSARKRPRQDCKMADAERLHLIKIEK